MCMKCGANEKCAKCVKVSIVVFIVFLLIQVILAAVKGVYTNNIANSDVS